jgi:type I restriction enzyme S subunit
MRSGLPRGWRMTTVEQAGRLDLGRQRHPDWHAGPEMRPYLRVANVFEDRIDTVDVKHMDFSGVFDRYRLHPGDVLLNEGQTPELLGRPAIYRGEPADCAFTNSLIRFRPNPDVLSEWALLVFRHYMRTGRFTRESRITTNIAHLSLGRLKSIEFPIPTTEEQRRIVEVVEDHLSRVEAGLAYIVAAERRVRRLSETAVERAVAGNWATVVIQDIASVGSGATPLRSRRDYYEGGTIPWVTSGALNDSIVREPTTLITDKALSETAVKLWPKGTLLIAMYGEGRTRGRCSELAFSSTTKQACAAVVLNAESQPLRPWLKLVLRSRYQQMRRLASGGVQPNLSLGLIKTMEVPIPPVEVQRSALARVAEADAVVGRLREDLNRARSRAEPLRRALLQSAVGGGLTGASRRNTTVQELAGV